MGSRESTRLKQLEKTNEETSTGDPGPGWCLRGLLHHPIGNPPVRGRGSAWADLMAGRELKDRHGATGVDGDRVHRWTGVGCDSLVSAQPYERLQHGPIKRKCVCCGPRYQRVRLRSSLVVHERQTLARTRDHPTLQFFGLPTKGLVAESALQQFGWRNEIEREVQASSAKNGAPVALPTTARFPPSLVAADAALGARGLRYREEVLTRLPAHRASQVQLLPPQPLGTWQNSHIGYQYAIRRI